MPIETGVVLPRQVKLKPAALAEVAQTAEDLGVHSLWLTEHIAIPVDIRSRYPYSTDGTPPFSHDGGPPEALVTLGFLASATRRIRLGSAVIPLFCFDPLTLAKMAATADLLSGGRIELGLGAGWLVEEAVVLGNPPDHRAGRLDETITILRKAWQDAYFEHHGRFYSFPAVGVHPHPAQGERLPIWIGGSSPAALRTTAKHAVGNIVWNATPVSVARVRQKLDALKARLRIAATLDLAEPVTVFRERVLGLKSAGADLILLTHSSADADGLIEDLRRYLEQTNGL